jgi:hypothetical protein
LVESQLVVRSEAILQQQVCDYLRVKYPHILFRSDFAAGIKMTMGQAAKHKRLQSCRAWPDLFIARPQNEYAGLFIELKAVNIYKKDGGLLKNEHLQEQAEVLARLNMLGYRAEFAVGLEQAKTLIDDYLV